MKLASNEQLSTENCCYGQARQCRSLDVHRHHAACLRRPGHDLLRLGRHGQGALRLRLRISAQAVGLGSRRPGGHAHCHEDRLQAPPAPGAGFHIARHYHAVPDFRLLPRSRARHAPLVSLRTSLIPAVRIRQARHHPLLSVVPERQSRGKQNQLHGRLAQHAHPRHRAHVRLSRTYRLPARPRHCHRLCRNHRLHPVRRRHPPSLFRIRLRRRHRSRSIS